MSGQATGWVLRHGPHPDHVDRHGAAYGARARGLRMVLHTVADAANADGDNAHPGIEAVQRGSLYGRRHAIDLLAELVAEGWLEVKETGGGRGLATVYRLVMERNSAMAALETVQSPPLKGAITSAKQCTGEPETVHCGAETVQSRVHPNVLSNELLNEKNNEKNNARPGTLVSEADGLGASSALADGDLIDDHHDGFASSAFDLFWERYPRRVAKMAARRAWARAVKVAGGPGPIMAGLSSAVFSPDPAFIPHPASWLNAGRWMDEPDPPKRARRGALISPEFDRSGGEFDADAWSDEALDAFHRQIGRIDDEPDPDLWSPEAVAAAADQGGGRNVRS